MTVEQEDFLNKLENALAHLVHNGNNKWAKALAPVIDFLDKEEFVMAVLEAEAANLPPQLIENLRKTYNVKILA
jgi:hypothetical protein